MSAMGVLAHRLRTLDRSLVPPSTCVCRVTFKHLRSNLLSFGTLGQLFRIPPFSAQKSLSAGGRGGLGAHAKFQNPTTTPSERISNAPEERGEKNALYSGHIRLCQQPSAAQALRSDQKQLWEPPCPPPPLGYFLKKCTELPERTVQVAVLLVRSALERCSCTQQVSTIIRGT
jgi:hypothetical protein